MALVWLGGFDDHGQSRARKTFDRVAMNRLHGLGPISDPKSEAKSVALTDEGRGAAEQAFRKLFGPRCENLPPTVPGGPRSTNNLTH